MHVTERVDGDRAFRRDADVMAAIGLAPGALGHGLGLDAAQNEPRLIRGAPSFDPESP